MFLQGLNDYSSLYLANVRKLKFIGSMCNKSKLFHCAYYRLSIWSVYIYSWEQPREEKDDVFLLQHIS